MPEEDKNLYYTYAEEILTSQQEEVLNASNYWHKTNKLLRNFIAPFGSIDSFLKEINNSSSLYALWLKEDKEIAKAINENFGYCNKKVHEIPKYKNNRLRCT